MVLFDWAEYDMKPKKERFEANDDVVIYAIFSFLLGYKGLLLQALTDEQMQRVDGQKTYLNEKDEDKQRKIGPTG